MTGTALARRTELRSAVNVPVELYSLDNAAFEITHTINVSEHGACVSSDTAWAADQRVSIRALDGQLKSHARIVYCQHLCGRGYVIGVQLQQPNGAWPAKLKALAASNGL
jgi:hypothetical protein